MYFSHLLSILVGCIEQTLTQNCIVIVKLVEEVDLSNNLGSITIARDRDVGPYVKPYMLLSIVNTTDRKTITSAIIFVAV